MRAILKGALSAAPSIYGQCKWFETRLRYALGLPHEADFEFFRTLPRHGLFVDIGANIGQSALSFAAVCPGWEIISFEPNPALTKYLRRTAQVLHGSHTWHTMALGATSGRVPFYLPVRNGLEATQEGTCHQSALTDAAAQTRLGAGWCVRTIEVPVERFDSLGLRPDVVKIDVQGFEYEVLQGMRATLDSWPPRALYLEYGPDIARVTDFLGSFGYTPWQVKGRELSPWNGSNCGNVVYQH